MKAIVSVLWFIGHAVLAQTAVNKSFEAQTNQTINFYFDHPELIRFSTWDQKEVQITGSVSVNGGENDDAFVLSSSTTGQILNIRGEMKDLKSLPKRVTIVHKGEKITFRDKAEFSKWSRDKGINHFDMMSTGVDIDIVLEVKVPRSAAVTVDAVYGMVEIRNFDAPIEVVATYGGVDAALNAKATGELLAETNYGQIYSNLDVKFEGKTGDFHQLVRAKPGMGAKQSFISKYGNVYLRKPL